MARRKRKDSGDEGAPAWIVTFSDLMSLLLTFFVLLLSFSTISEEDFSEAMGSVQGALGVFTGLPSPVPFPGATSARRKEQSQSEQAARRLRRKLQVEGLEKQVKIEYDAKGGLKISLPNSFLFDSGSADLKPEALPLLRDVGEVLSELPDTFIEVRGHTDTLPTSVAGRFRDNYDLSYFRAHSVADRLITVGGVPEEQFEIVAAGPNQPIATNTTEEGRRSNRRVEIFVRGLVDESKMTPLDRDYEGLDTVRPQEDLPLSPGDLEELR